MIAGSATGVGSLPGADFQQATELVLSHLPEFPHIPELPSRGPWFDLVGRGCGLLVDLPAHFDVEQWSFDRNGRAGSDVRRARSGLADDVEVFAEMVDDFLEQGSDEHDDRSAGLKLQACGPITLACGVELPNGQAAVSDTVALRDIGASLAEGLGQYLDTALRLLPASRGVVVQLDEPALTAAATGGVPTSSGLSKYRPLSSQEVRGTLTQVLESITRRESDAVLHTCAPDVPVDLLSTVGAPALSIDVTLLSPSSQSASDLARWLDAGRVLFAGVELSPTEASVVADEGTDVGMTQSTLESTLESTLASTLASTLGQLMGVDWLRARAREQVVVTPRCGLAGVSLEAAKERYCHAREIQHALNSGAHGG